MRGPFRRTEHRDYDTLEEVEMDLAEDAPDAAPEPEPVKEID